MLVLLCREGYEKELSAEVNNYMLSNNLDGYVVAKQGTGLVVYKFNTDKFEVFNSLYQNFNFYDLKYARQAFWGIAYLENLPAEDRITPIIAAMNIDSLEYFPKKNYKQAFVETPDTEKSKPLLPFCKSFSNAFDRVIQKKLNRRPNSGTSCDLHLLFLDYDKVYVGISLPEKASHWPMGIPRLKFPAQAPSRSTLKLEEAFLVLLTEKDRSEVLQAGGIAVDLGAAPGGWTYQLLKNKMFVLAIDNGKIDEKLMQTDMIEHIKHDGFTFTPKKDVNLMVCDMVEQPFKVTQLAVHWIVNGLCKNTIFNLKLPMKQKLPEVERCLAYIRQNLDKTNVKYVLRCKHLYHDRDEVTVFIGMKYN